MATRQSIERNVALKLGFNGIEPYDKFISHILSSDEYNRLLHKAGIDLNKNESKNEEASVNYLIDKLKAKATNYIRSGQESIQIKEFRKVLREQIRQILKEGPVDNTTIKFLYDKIGNINNGSVWAEEFNRQDLLKDGLSIDDYFNIAKQITNKSFINNDSFWEDFAFSVEEEHKIHLKV